MAMSVHPTQTVSKAIILLCRCDRQRTVIDSDSVKSMKSTFMHHMHMYHAYALIGFIIHNIMVDQVVIMSTSTSSMYVVNVESVDNVSVHMHYKWLINIKFYSVVIMMCWKGMFLARR